MKKRRDGLETSLRQRVCKNLALLLLCFGLAPYAAKAEPPAVLTDPTETSVVPPPALNGQQPIQIRVGLYILNLVSLNEVEQTFTCTAYIIETWKDPRLAFSPGPDGPAARFYRKA